jgi:hypothetical protein
MMQTTLFSLCAANTAVKNLLGTAPVRLYPFGTAPQNVVKPYAVYQTISGSPENLLSGAPDIDGIMQQVDEYANRDVVCRLRMECELARLMKDKDRSDARNIANRVFREASSINARPIAEKADALLLRL